MNAVMVPDGVDEAQVRIHLLERFSLEIGSGLGPLKGKIWRIGLMGESASERHVMLCLAALGDALAAQGRNVSARDALKAAAR
jgi:alanine-glyoxylate transaminase/serine-glyoxylate transaminase/serine-pyruvate transaminase